MPYVVKTAPFNGNPVLLALRTSMDGVSHVRPATRQSNDQDKATRQRRDHDVEVNTRMMRINADASNGAIRRLSAKHAKERQN